MSARVRDYYAEEVEFLTSAGCRPETILARLDVKPANLERALQRAGRHDLARLFGNKAVQPERVFKHKPGACVDCGTTIREDSQRCRPCELVRRWGRSA